MNILSEPQKIHSLISRHADAHNLISHQETQMILDRLSSLNSGLQTLNSCIQDASEVNDALAMIVIMMDAAYDQRLDADRLRCLLDPLRQKLGQAIERIREIT